MASIDKKREAFTSPFLSIKRKVCSGLPAGLHNAWQFTLVGPFAKLITAKAKIAIDTTGFASGPATVTDPSGGTVAGKGLNFAMYLETRHGISRCIKCCH
jgi:hypothetical protein